MKYEFVVIGGGIVGISTAWQLQQRYPDKQVLLLEKEQGFALHQTGHNSGVIHAGVYYQPGSMKARFCKQGAEDTIAFCKRHKIPYQQCGKLLVATNQIEYKRMEALQKRCLENGIEVSWLTQKQLKEAEPNISGISAILVQTTSIVDYKKVSEKMATCFLECGGKVELMREVTGIRESESGIVVNTDERKYEADFLVSCAGLMADRLVKMHGLDLSFQIIPFRGEYYRLPEDKNDLIEHLIYPIPDPDLPFLGVHLTRMIDGSTTVGPNAVLGWKREGYGKINIDVKDVCEMLRFEGFWRVLSANIDSGMSEMKNSLWKRGYLKLVQKYCPQLTIDDLLPYTAGIRAQAVLVDGTLVHDFLFAESSRSLHVCNAPSPAATSSIPVGNYLCDKVSEKYMC